MALPSFADPADYEDTFGASTTRTAGDLDAASAAIRRYCRWHIWPNITETLTLDGPGVSLLTVPTLALTAVTSLTETARGAGQTPQVISSTDLEWSAAGLIWHVTHRCWTARARGLVVTISHGLDDVADLRRLTLDLAQRAESNPAGRSSIQVGQRMESFGSTPAPSGILGPELAILDTYRRVI